MPIQQSVSWWCYENSGIAPHDLVKTIADIGYTGVELLPPEYFQMAKDAGLEIVSTQAFMPLEVGLNKHENFPKIEAMFAQNLELAEEWHIPYLIVFSGNREGQSDEEGLAITVENLRKIVPRAEEAGITLILELLNSKLDHPDFMCDSTAWGVEVCKQVDSPHLKLLYDIYHMQVMEGDVIQTIRDNHQYIGYYHTAGVPGRAEIDDTQELYYPAIVRAIAETGFTGYIGQEFIPKGDPKKALATAYHICNVE